ncbi:MAG: hypothetical protein GQ559_04035 [Desulfobulbaceae bacterium]|nr:hypothetical protein [Desulfobulbaceae bacterium]
MSDRDRYRAKPTFVRMAATLIIVVLGFSVWIWGFFHSPAGSRERRMERAYVASNLVTRAPDYEDEKKLAQAYWWRYHDVRKDWLWGEKGTMGVRGPRDHYRLHGRREGRIWGPLSEEERGKSVEQPGESKMP